MKKQNILTSFWLLGGAYFVLAVIGGVRTYSPVPLMDMWDGYSR
jgi:hypothetical protein